MDDLCHREHDPSDRTPSDLVACSVEMQTIIEILVQRTLFLPARLPDHRPHIGDRDLQPLAYLLCCLRVRLGRLEVAMRPPYMCVHRWRGDENDASARRIVCRRGRPDHLDERLEVLLILVVGYVLRTRRYGRIVRTEPYDEQLHFGEPAVLHRKDLGTSAECLAW